MSKNLTRKGIAFGALVALGASVFAGSPATAASAYIATEAYHGPSTNFTAVASSGYGLILNTTFKSLPDGLDADNLKYKVEIVTPGFETDNVAASDALTDVTLTAAVDSNTSGVAFGIGEAKDVGNANSGGNPVAQTTDWGDTSATNFGQISVFAAKAAAEGGADAAGEAAAVAPDFTDNNLLKLSLAEELDANLVVRVTPWVDTIANNKIDASEVAVGDAVDVTFVPLADVAVSVKLEAPVLGAATILGYVTMGGVNLGNFDVVNSSDIELYTIDRPGTVAAALGTAAAAAANVLETDLTYDAVDDRLEALTTLNAAAEAGTYQARFSLSGAAADNIFAGNESVTLASATAVAKTVDADNNEGIQAAKAVVGADVVQATGATAAAGVDILARATSAKTINFTSQLYKTYDATSPVLAGAGVVATVTISRATIAKLDAATVITAGGKTISGNKLTVSFDVVSDSTGKIAFSLTTNSAKAADELEIDIAAEGETATQQTLKWVEESYTLYTSNGTSAIKVAIGGSTKVDFVAKDQFGTTPASAQVQVTRANSSGDRDLLAEQASFAYNTALTAGRGTVTITDNGAAATTGIDTITAQLQVAAAAGGGYVNKGSAVNFNLEYVSSLATATLTVAANNNGVKEGTTDVKAIALEEKALANYDDRYDSTTAVAYDWTPGFATAAATTTASNVIVSGTVKNAAGVGIAGVPVTISNAGLLFATATGSGRYALDSITVLSGSAGEYSVYVIGSTSGKRNVAVAAGALSGSVDLTFATGSTTASKMVLTGANTAKSGRTVDVVIKLTDKLGNAAQGVNVTLKSTGAGYLNVASGTTDAAGEVIAKLIVGVADAGVAVVSATATLTGVSTVVTKQILVGVSAKITKPAKGAVATVKNAKGGTVTVVRGTKSVTKIATSDTQKVTLKSGTGKVNVYVNGVKVASK